MALIDTSLVISGADPTIGTGTTKTFNKIEVVGSTTRRRDTTSEAGEPSDIVVKHALQGNDKDGTAVDRHLLQILSSDHDANGLLQTIGINITIAKPRMLFTNAQVKTRLNYLVNLLYDTGNLDAFLRGEG